LESKNEDLVKSIECGIWNTIVNGPFVPTTIVNGVHIEKYFDELNDVENKKIQYDCIAKNIITSSLNLDESLRVSQCNFARDVGYT